jgi:uncharacterized protein (TIGR02246 family)
MPNVSDDERAIRDLVDCWLVASAKGDIATVLGLMTDDAIFMVPGREPFGKAAYEAAAKAVQGIRIEGKSDILEIEIIGRFAYLRNFLEMTIVPPDGAPAVRKSGYVLTILRKEADGRWRLARDANLLI